MSEPVLLLVFNRLNEPLEVVRRIAEYRPARIYVAADGPRASRPGEAAQCARVRESVLAAIDWDCSVSTLFRDQNLGCGRAVHEAIDWFYGHEERGVVLEDDCVPDPTFFSFCSSLLQRYQNDQRVMHINGSNFQRRRSAGNASYYFSRLVHVWGWATWRRAWEGSPLRLPPAAERHPSVPNRYLRSMVASVGSGEADSWAVPWALFVWMNGGLAATPAVSLVENRGYGGEGTHTRHSPRWLRRVTYGSLPELTHPGGVVLDDEADREVMRNVYRYGPWQAYKDTRRAAARWSRSHVPTRRAC